MSASQQVTGIASGFDTASIVEQLMKIEKMPYEKLDLKKKTESLKLQAYQAVNSMMLKFTSSVGNLSSQKLWRSKSASSTNDKSLTATANEYAVNGSYSFKVAQLATATQFMSKGFASSKTALVKQPSGEQPYKIGSITMNNAKSRVDTSAKLETLNGGKGIYRGSIRVTDGGNNSSVIDLSGCDTMDDVVHAINNSTGGARITASIQDGKLTIADNSGQSGDIRVQNIGSGTTATDLGIAGSATGVLQGRNVFVLGNEMGLGMLNDGLGVEEGTMRLRVSDASTYVDVLVNVDECSTVGDIIKRVNTELEAWAARGYVDPNGGGDASQLLDGLKFGLNADKTGFGFTGAKENYSYSFSNHYYNNETHNMTAATQLGLDGKTYTVGVGESTVSFGRVLGDVNSPLLKNLSGANGYGIGEASGASRVPAKFDPATTNISDLNGGRGVDISRPLSIQLKEGGEDGSGGAGLPVVFDDIIDMAMLQRIIANDPADSTLDPAYKGGKVQNLVNFLNDQLADYADDPANMANGLKGLQIGTYTDASGRNLLMLSGAQAGYKMEVGGSLMADLGLTRIGANGIWMSDDSYYAPVGVPGDPDYEPGYAARQAALDDLYGLNASANTAYLDTDLEMSGASATTVRDLVGLMTRDGVDSTNPTAVDNWFAANFGGSLTVKVGANTATVDLSGISSLSLDTSVADIMDHINTQLKDQFALQGIAAPQLRVHTYGTSLQWSNVDTTQDFDVTGALGQTLGLNKSFDKDLIPPQLGDVMDYNYNVMEAGYLEKLEISAANGDNVLLSNLRGGAGLTFGGAVSDTLDIDLGSAGTVSLTLGEIAQYLTDHYSGPNTSLNDYVDTLNILVDQKLNSPGGLNDGVPAGDEVAFKFKVGNGKIEVGDFENVDSFKLSGPLADADKMALGPIEVTAPEAGKSYGLSNLTAYKLVYADIEGLGQIKLELGDGTDITLNTDDLTGESTLSDLIDHLNSQLEAAGGDFADIRFTVNSAGTGIAVDNQSNNSVSFVDIPGNRIGKDLGLIDANGKGVEVDSYSIHNSGSLGRQYISRATKLSDYMGTADLGSILITNAGGATWEADLSGCKTIGDLLDFVNFQAGFGVQLEINEFGDGIRAVEAYPPEAIPPVKPTGNISIADVDGGSIAKKLGIAGTGVRNLDGWGDNSVLEGSQKTVIDVMSSDTLESLMYRISEKGGYKTAIVNDGTTTNPYRLTISSGSTGEASDFVIESDLDIFGFNQTSRGKDSKVLYGDPNSSASPIMLSSSTNSNSNAILGMTLELKSVTSEYVTINVDTDKEKVTEELKNMVQTYNDLNDLISFLDAYDEETGEPGVLFGDTNVRKLMEDINDMFYLVFNPNQKVIGSTNDKGELNTWTWMDLGVNLTAKNTASDGSGSWYSSMDLDLDKMDEMVAKNWDILYEMLAGQRNASDSTLDKSVRATGSFNGTAADGFSVDNAINGDSNTGSWGVNNGFMADGTIEDGENEYTIYFQKPTTMSRMSIYHYDSDTALKNFTVEYMDAATGKWEVFRDITNNSVDANHLGMSLPTTVSAIRIKASSTNADDGKFRLLDVQVFEDIGLAGQLNQLTSRLGDTTNGWLRERSNEIDDTLKDIEEQMERLAERLDTKEASLWKRFTAMESALSQLQNQSSYFTSMMDSMSTNSKK